MICKFLEIRYIVGFNVVESFAALLLHYFFGRRGKSGRDRVGRGG